MFNKQNEFAFSQLEQTGLMCTITKSEKERRTPNIVFLRNNVKELTAIDNGYTAIFPYNNKVARSLLDFIVNEHECCRFFHFELSFLKNEEKIEFRVITKGSEYARNFEEIFKAIFKT